MPLEPFDGNTFVAFTDIAGFKHMMRNRERASRALDALYGGGYNVLERAGQTAVPVSGLFVSDCGVIYAADRLNQGPVDQLRAVCEAIALLHKWCFDRAVMLATSIAYGSFTYQERVEFRGIGKNPIVGPAYLAAYLDHCDAGTKLYVPEVRIVRQNLPDLAEQYCESGGDGLARKLRKEEKHYYFEWMREF